MPYSGKLDWTNGDAVTAADLNRIEQAIAKIWDRTGGVVNFDDLSFTGTDDQKHVAGWNYARNATVKPVMQYPDRTFGPLSTPIAAFSGMRAIGPTGMDGVKNLELSSGNLVNHRVRVEAGTGASSLFVQSASLSEVGFAGIAFSGSAGSQWWHNTNGSTQSVYPAHFHSLAFDGFLNVFGNDAQKFTCTQGYFSGHWTVLNYSGTPIHIGGADTFFNWYLNSNSPASVDGNGNPILWFDYMEKTVVMYNFITAENDWLGVRVSGPVERALRFYGGTYEGRASGNPATRALFDIQGGHVIIRDADFGYVVNTDTNGAITQSGGVLELHSPHYRKASAAATTFPLLYQTGGIAHVSKPFSADGNAIRIRWKDAALGSQDADYPYPTANSISTW